MVRLLCSGNGRHGHTVIICKQAYDLRAASCCPLFCCVRTQGANFEGKMTKCKERGGGEGSVDFKKIEKGTENEQSVIFE